MEMKGNEDEAKMKIRWKLLNQDAKRGTQKKREGENTNTGHLAQRGQNLEGQGKERQRQTDTEQDQRRGGGRKRLNQPTTAKPTPT